MRNFATIAQKFGTDKFEHGYMPYYEFHLPEKIRTMLEIGVAKGASALMWSEIFGEEELDLHIIDLFENEEFVSAKWCRNRGFVPHKGDQSDFKFLYTITNQFDVIVEDGSHNSYDQIASFMHLFQNNLRSGGIYVVEDLHCCKQPFYRQKNRVEYQDTLLNILIKYSHTGDLSSRFFPNEFEGEINDSLNETFKGMIESVSVYDDKIAFIKRK